MPYNQNEINMDSAILITNPYTWFNFCGIHYVSVTEKCQNILNKLSDIHLHASILHYPSKSNGNIKNFCNNKNPTISIFEEAIEMLRDGSKELSQKQLRAIYEINELIKTEKSNIFWHNFWMSLLVGVLIVLIVPFVITGLFMLNDGAGDSFFDYHYSYTGYIDALFKDMKIVTHYIENELKLTLNKPDSDPDGFDIHIDSTLTWA